MLNADKGVTVKWRTPYKSEGAADAKKDSQYTGGGLAWGSGTTPTLTRDLVLFTDNQKPVNLLALSSKTGKIVAQTPVLEALPEDTPVSVENSILVYSSGADKTSVLVCNWFGAGNAGLADPNADSAVQSYENLYDANWTEKGNAYIAPGVERVDVLKDGSGYRTEKVWSRDDIQDTSMIKLSTATGYLYGYWQNLDSGMWCYEILDFDTGETVREIPVSKVASYNNMAVGLTADIRGNALYCPTNNMEVVRLQDSFVYLPDSPAKTVDPNHMQRYRMDAADFAQKSGTELKPATYLMKATVTNPGGKTRIAFKVNGLEKKASDYSLFTESQNGGLAEMNKDQWVLTDSEGQEVGDEQLKEETTYQVRFDMMPDSGEAAGSANIAAILAAE